MHQQPAAHAPRRPPSRGRARPDLQSRALATLACLLLPLPLGCAAPYGRSSGAEESAAATATTDEPTAVQGEYLPAEVATVGWDRITGGPIVLVRDQLSGRVVPIWIGVPEGRAIASALADLEMPRPMTHDLMANLLSRLDAEVEELLIHDLVNGTFFALLRLRKPDGERLLVDTRPSDGLALVLRTGATIRIARKVVDESPDFEFLAPEGDAQIVRALGLTLVAPNTELRDRFALPDRPGLVVTHAVGAAERAGLLRGDLLISAGGRPMTEPVQFLDLLGEETGQRLAITYWRDGQEHRTELETTATDEENDQPARTA